MSKAIHPNVGAAVLVGSARDFEVAAGKASSKKWKQSFKVLVHSALGTCTDRKSVV